MTLGAALGWKYNHEPGIETRDGALTAWPDSLGPMPSEQQQRAVVAEYEAHMAATAGEPDEHDVLLQAVKKRLKPKELVAARAELTRHGGTADDSEPRPSFPKRLFRLMFRGIRRPEKAHRS